jgi:hypothetical protein
VVGDKMTTLKTFNELRKINVNDKIEKKEGLTYLSWAYAWDQFKQVCPDANYEIMKNFQTNLPFFEDECGVIVYTKVTTNNVTHEMWLPVMDSSNKAMKRTPYKYQTRSGEKTVQAFTMFDVNKTIMRCLVKNLAMFGFALYIFAGEDLPDEDPPNQKNYRIDFGKKYLGKALHEVDPDELKESIKYFERQERETGVPTSGKAKIFVELATEFLHQGE